ncbi:MAG: UDP-N-acetylmuramate dehydrogenase [Candidatus Margulisbacteria bacterium]|nr:UDP-N-acetylmuramate dehydrogenase [Candidatus Margulisiibacteriota bacterium]
MKYRRNEPLSKHTSYKIGGPADYLCQPKSLTELKSALQFAKNNKLPVAVIGSGTNLLAPDEGFRGLVIKFGQALNGISIKGSQVTVGSGVTIAQLLSILAHKRLGGLEFLASIPGSIGGAVVMNAGAWGDEIGKHIIKIEAVTKEGKIRTITQRQMHFKYRSSILQKQPWIVVSVTLKLSKKKKTVLQKMIKNYLALRREKHPLGQPNCGSVFKNPARKLAPLPAGKLIESAGLKGLKVGQAQVSKKHANFIVNLGGATAQDVTQLIQLVQKAVWKRFKIKLEPEVKTMVEF